MLFYILTQVSIHIAATHIGWVHNQRRILLRKSQNHLKLLKVAADGERHGVLTLPTLEMLGQEGAGGVGELELHYGAEGCGVLQQLEASYEFVGLGFGGGTLEEVVEEGADLGLGIGVGRGGCEIPRSRHIEHAGHAVGIGKGGIPEENVIDILQTFCNLYGKKTVF